MKFPLKTILYGTAISLVFGIIQTQAATYIVSPGDDLQAAIDLTNTGDTIQFNPGIYTVTSELLIQNKGITLQGLSKATGTIIQRDTVSASNHRIFNIQGPTPTGPAFIYNPTLATILDGFTIKNGITSGVGGNILVMESPYSIIQNSIIEFGNANSGGGIAMQVGGTLLNSIVRNNSTVNSAQNFGGGIRLDFGGNTITNSIIYNNTGDVGGGIGIRNGGINNDPAFGGGDSRVRINNSTIANNTVDGIPAFGIYGGGVGSQLFAREAFILDSIVAANTTNDIQNITIQNGGTLTVTYTDNEASLYLGTGNISADPLFTGSGEPWDLYRLQAGSPALTTSSTGGPMGAVLTRSIFVIPEPSSALLLGLAGLILICQRLRRR